MRLDTSYLNPLDTVLPGKRFSTLGVNLDSGGAGSTLEKRCALIALASFDQNTLPQLDALDEVRSAADALAKQGVTLRDAQRSVHLAVGGILKRRCVGREGTVVDGAVFMMRVVELLGNVVSGVYMDHCRRDSGQSRELAAQLVDLVTSGDPDARVAAERSGVELAGEYDVVVVQFVENVDGSDRTASRRVDDAAIVNAVAAVSNCVDGCVPLLSLAGHGGTLLIPTDVDNSVETCVAALSSALGVEIFAAATRTSIDEMVGVLAHCRELVALARCLGMQPQLYRTADLALEYQLSRPGPGRSKLRSVIAPLASYPELVHTLRTFISSEANRRASAKSLYVHPNTVDYRLKRIEQLTGVDPLSSAGLMALHAALVVDSLARAQGSGPDVSEVVARAS